jgi:hypothetical protein
MYQGGEKEARTIFHHRKCVLLIEHLFRQSTVVHYNTLVYVSLLHTRIQLKILLHVTRKHTNFYQDTGYPD